MATAPDPRRLAARRRAEAFKALRWVVLDGDRELEFRPADMTGLDSAELVRQAGFGELELIGRLSPTSQDLGAVAAVVWLARRRLEPQLTYAEVAGSIRLGGETVVAFSDEDDDVGGDAVPLDAAAAG